MATNKTTTNKVLLQYLVEQGTQAKVVTANEAIKRSMAEVEQAYKTGGSVGASELRRVTKEAKSLTSELLDLESGFHDVGSDVPRELQDVIDKVEKLNKSIRDGTGDIRDMDAEFTQTSKDVALAGDVGSQARTIGGAAGAFGGAGIQQAVGAGSELFDVVEALPRLKVALRGMPSVIGSFATSLGPVGIGLGAIAGVTAIAVAGLVSNMKEQAEAARALIAAEETYYTIRATGTKETAQAEIDANVIQLGILSDRVRSLQELKRAADERNALARAQEKNLFAAISTGIADIFATDDAEEYGKEIGVIEAEFATLSDTTNLLIAGLMEGEFATESAAEAEARLAAERTKAALAIVAAANTEQQRVQMTQALSQQSTEQLDARTKAIEDEIEATRAALQVLSDSGVVTDETNAATSAYITTLQNLETEMNFIDNTARSLATQREAETSAMEAQAEEQQRAIDLTKEEVTEARRRFDIVKDTMLKRAELERNHADELIAISERAAEEAEKALSRLEEKLGSLDQSLGRDLEDAQIKGQRKVLEAQIDAQREEVKAKRDHVRKLEDIRRNADETELDLRQNRDFKGVANARRAARVAIQNEQREFARREEDRIEQLGQEASDRQAAFAQERQDRLKKFRQDTYDARVAYQKQRSDQQIANAQTIMQARAKHVQELSDLQQSGIQALTIRRQISDTEIMMMSQVANAAQSFFQQLAAFQAQGSNTTNNTNNNTNNNSVSISGTQILQDTATVVSTVFDVFQGLLS